MVEILEVKRGRRKMDIKRGDIFLADLSPVIGIEQGGVRPVMVIQNDIANQFSPTVIISAITSQINKAKLPSHVELIAEKYNLPKDSVVLLEQIRTIDKMRLVEKLFSAGNDIELMKCITDAYLVAGGAVIFSEEEKNSEQEYYKFKIDSVVNIVEDNEYEFKEIRGRNPKNSIISKVSQYATSFLNNQGGRILYGISDNRIVKGFTADANVIDEIKRDIYESLRHIQPTLSGNHYQIKFHSVYDSDSNVIADLYVLEVGIPPSRDKNAIFFDKGKDLYIRVDGVTQLLKGTEIISFIQAKLLEI